MVFVLHQVAFEVIIRFIVPDISSFFGCDSGFAGGEDGK